MCVCVCVWREREREQNQSIDWQNLREHIIPVSTWNSIFNLTIAALQMGLSLCLFTWSKAEMDHLDWLRVVISLTGFEPNHQLKKSMPLTIKPRVILRIDRKFYNLPENKMELSWFGSKTYKILFVLLDYFHSLLSKSDWFFQLYFSFKCTFHKRILRFTEIIFLYIYSVYEKAFNESDCGKRIIQEKFKL